MRSKHLSLILLFVVLATSCLYLGCADGYNLDVDWNKRVGNYSYADMVDDFGPPWAAQTNYDYSKTCQWPIYSGHDYRVYSKLHGRDAEISGSKDPNLKLAFHYQMTFDTNGTLVKWGKVTH
jgi:hypothetical protein